MRPDAVKAVLVGFHEVGQKIGASVGKTDCVVVLPDCGRGQIGGVLERIAHSGLKVEIDKDLVVEDRSQREKRWCQWNDGHNYRR